MKINKNIAVSDSGFMFNPGTGESYSLNPIGAKIIELIKSEKTYEQIMAVIMAEYETSDAICEKDLQDFLQHLEHYQIIEIKN